MGPPYSFLEVEKSCWFFVDFSHGPIYWRPFNEKSAFLRKIHFTEGVEHAKSRNLCIFQRRPPHFRSKSITFQDIAPSVRSAESLAFRNWVRSHLPSGASRLTQQITAATVAHHFWAGEHNVAIVEGGAQLSHHFHYEEHSMANLLNRFLSWGFKTLFACVGSPKISPAG